MVSRVIDTYFIGLGIYDTDSEASSRESDREESGHENTVDSDQELRVC